MLLEDGILVLCAQGHKVGHVDLIEGGKGSGGILGFLEAFGDPKTHPVHLDMTFRSITGSCGA